MKKKLFSLVATALLSLGISANAFASDCLLGVVNMQQILQSYPGINKIIQEVNAEKARLQADVNSRSTNLSEKEKAELIINANKAFVAFEQSKLEPVQKKIKKTIDKVAKTNNIQNVVNANIMVSGGKDLTQDVIKALNPQAVNPQI